MFPHARAFAGSPNDIVKRYEEIARQSDKKFNGFSPVRGKELYFHKEQSAKGGISCSTCHTSDPKSTGRTRANKDIEPLAPSANDKRFTDYKHVEKWFARNCDDVLRRPCSAQEKGDFVTYLLSIK
jgi:hypothetical protein